MPKGIGVIYSGFPQLHPVILDGMVDETDEFKQGSVHAYSQRVGIMEEYYSA